MAVGVPNSVAGTGAAGFGGGLCASGSTLGKGAAEGSGLWASGSTLGASDKSGKGTAGFASATGVGVDVGAISGLAGFSAPGATPGALSGGETSILSSCAASFTVFRSSAAGWRARAVMAAMGNAGGTTLEDDSEGGGGGLGSSRLDGRTIRATSVIFALRRKMKPKGVSDRVTGEAGGMVFGVLAEEVPGEIGDETGTWSTRTGSAFGASRGKGAAAIGLEGDEASLGG